MKVKTLVERLEELPAEFGMPITQLSIEAGLDMKRIGVILKWLQDGKNINFEGIYNMAEGLELIAVVFYRASDGHVEDLGHPGYLYGEEVYNYVGEVFTKYRELSNRTQAQIGEQTGISQPSINRYENGRLPACQYLDVIARALGLVPNYLVQKLERPTPEGSKPSS